MRQRRSGLVAEPAGPAARRGAAGFTLIEVLAALLVVSLVLGVVLSIFGGGFTAVRRADERATAALIATSVLAATGREQPLAAGFAEGVFDNGYRWRRWIEPYRQEVLGDDDPEQLAYRVVVNVSWPGAGAEDGVTLSTLRLAGSDALELLQ